MNLLTAGINFDKRRFKQDIQVFQQPHVHQAASVDARKKVAVARLVTGDVDSENFASDEALNVFRKQNKIKVYGSDCPAPVRSFAQLMQKHQLKQGLMRQVLEMGFTELTSVQMQAVPLIMDGRDNICCAPTGSGKTMAYLLPTIALLGGKHETLCRLLIIAPSRELAQQIHRIATKLTAGSELKVCLLSKSNQAQPDKKIDVLISTPMRLVAAIAADQMDLSAVQNLVIDEADKLFEMNFLPQIDAIIAACTNPQVRKCLFSATIDSSIEQLAQSVMMDPVRVVVGQKNSAVSLVQQELVYVGRQDGKLMALRNIVQEGIKPPVLIFVESIESAELLYADLQRNSQLRVGVIHSDRTHAQRDDTIRQFRRGECWILIATDLLGRGLDFKGVSLVINYDMPHSVAGYIHRVGRTGRAGHRGRAITFFMRQDRDKLRGIATVIKQSGGEVPEWMTQLPRKKKWRGGVSGGTSTE